MSFILDALKKIEEDKRRAQAHPTTEVVATRESIGASRRGVLVMVGIAVASGALTAGFLMLARGGGSTSAVEVAGASPGELPVPHGSDAPVASETRAVLANEAVGADAPVPEPATEISTGPPAARGRRAETSPPKPVAREVAPALDTSASGPRPKPDAEPEPEGNSQSEKATQPDPEPEAEQGAASDSTTVDPQEGEAAAFRLVGRESPRLYGGPVVSASGNGGTDSETVEDEASLPDNFPKFVLQGTSVINGAPVAVINDQRVFEGDSVEGARVVGIEERSVELELEGIRFRIQL
jgi:hypothetical protein